MSAKGNRKAKRAPRGRAPEKKRIEPAEGTPPPLDRLAPDKLAQFLQLALTPEELLSLCRDVGAQPTGGYRLERLSQSEHARLLATDYLEKPRTQTRINDAVLGILKTPALRSLWMTAQAAKELGQLLAGDPVSAQARLAWRCMGDGDPAVRAVADQAIDHGMALIESYESAAQEEAAKTPSAPAKVDLDERLATLEKRLERSEKDRETARAQLQQARTEIAERDNRLNEHKQDATRLRVEAAAHIAELSKYQAAESKDERRGATELRKLSAEKAHLETRMGAIEDRLAQEKRKVAELERQLAERERPGLNLPPGDDPHQEASALEFTTPLFTDEFYKSVEGWDRRVLKVAFEKALLLAKDRRHPSLRAIGLVGFDNLFRIRIASDVRLIYRRADDGRLEILALIDREDLDRYVRQVRTRLEG